MSTEHLNHEPSPALDAEWEKQMQSFVESMDDSSPKKTPKEKKEPSKWWLALKGRFRRRTLQLIITSIATILLAVTALVVSISWKDVIKKNKTDKEETNPTIEIENATPKITLLNKTEPTDNHPLLSHIKIQNTDDSFEILYDEKAKTYHLQNYQDIDLSANMIHTLRYYTEKIEALEKVKDVAELSAYGLDKPQATASMQYTDDTTAQILIGNKTPSGNGFYGKLKGTDGIYIFDTDLSAVFCLRSTAFADTTLITAPSVKPSDETGTPILRSVHYSGTAYSTPLIIRRSNHNDGPEFKYFPYIITSPYTRCTISDVSDNFSRLSTLTAEQALFLHPTKEQKKKMGFDNPLIQLKATMAVEVEEETEDTTATAPKTYYNSIDYHITVGSLDENGNYIAMAEGINAIFLISKDSFGYVFDRTYENSVTDYLFFKPISDVSRIHVEANGKTYEYHLKHYPEKNDTDEQLVVSSDGKVYPTSDFRTLYELLMGLRRHGTTKETVSGDADLTISLYNMDGTLYLSSSYYELSGALCLAKTTEGELFTTLWSDVTFFIKQIDNYANGRPVLIDN